MVVCLIQLRELKLTCQIDLLLLPMCVQINTQVEVYEEKSLLLEIIGGGVGGLVLLALITAGLYKVGTETSPDINPLEIIRYSGISNMLHDVFDYS